ncbi:MAG TPA: hypothetical protein VLJ15_08350 [Gammaproteobacteria bacterium]|nr:hypothetical protein [Gammaproteobacteria bacterium]
MLNQRSSSINALGAAQPLLEEYDEKSGHSSSGNTTNIMVAIAPAKPNPPTPDLEPVLKNLQRKSRFNRCADYTDRHASKIGAAFVLVIAGSSFGVMWSEHYAPLVDTFANLEFLRQLYHAEYNASDCPEESYWHHPEVFIDCLVDEKGKIAPVDNLLLTQEDYCLTGSLIACDSPYPEQLIEQLPPVCIPVMHNLCSVLREINDKEVAEMLSVLLLIFVPCMLSVACICGLYCTNRKLGTITDREEKEIKDILDNRGLYHVASSQYLTYLIRFQMYDATSLELKTHLGIMPDSLLQIILDYVDVLGMKNPATCSIVRKELNKATLKYFPQEKTLHRLFKQIPANCPHDHSRVKIKDKGHCRKGLDANAVANRIMAFIG